jgi:hypothetical protein
VHGASIGGDARQLLGARNGSGDTALHFAAAQGAAVTQELLRRMATAVAAGGGGGGGESFPRVYWVAVPEASRARRVNRPAPSRRWMRC